MGPMYWSPYRAVLPRCLRDELVMTKSPLAIVEPRRWGSVATRIFQELTMKKTIRKKLALETTTLRTLLEGELIAAQGGMRGVSVGTCTACLPTYNPTCEFSCVGMCA